MSSMTIKVGGHEFLLAESDIINPDDYFSGYEDVLWVFHDHGYVVGAWFGSLESDGLDALADKGLLDFLKVEDEDPDYPSVEGLSYLGNYGDPYDVESLASFSIKVSPPTVVAQLMQQELSPE